MQESSLVNEIRRVNPDGIALPVLRELVREIQMKTPEQVRRDAQYWEDSNWKQWRQHSSHNPW